jgi:uncharacterized protein (TIGR02145 family)
MRNKNFIVSGIFFAVFLLAAFENTNDKNSKAGLQNSSALVTKTKSPDAISNPGEIKIGTQTWATENLDVSKFRNGDPIPTDMDAEEGKPACCYYDNDPANGEKYGRLYNWYAVTDPRGLAPRGWHIPSAAEWMTLVRYLGGWDSVGTKLKSSSGWNADGNGSNETGFTGLPGGEAGSGSVNDPFYGIGDTGFWWSSTVHPVIGAYDLYLDNTSADMGKSLKTEGLSVRCIKD